MNFYTFLLSILCAVLLSVVAALFAMNRLKGEPIDLTVAPPAIEDVRASLFPEQSRAVEELLKAILARQDNIERQEALLGEREAQIKKESIALARMRDELGNTKKEIEVYLLQLDEMAKDWDADERKNMRKLAEFYAKMDPDNAAQLLSNIEPERAARILSQLSDRQAGGIMDAAVKMGDNGIKLAVEWTEIIRQMKEQKKATQANPA